MAKKIIINNEQDYQKVLKKYNEITLIEQENDKKIQDIVRCAKESQVKLTETEKEFIKNNQKIRLDNIERADVLKNYMDKKIAYHAEERNNLQHQLEMAGENEDHTDESINDKSDNCCIIL